MWPGLIKMKPYAETYIVGTTNWFCVIHSKGYTCKSKIEYGKVDVAYILVLLLDNLEGAYA